MSSLYEQLFNKKEKLAVIGLGYVGMPIAVAFAKEIDTIGFDLNEEKINLYKKGIDPTKEVGNEAIRETNLLFTSDPLKLKEAKFFIVAVPTPINQDKTPDLKPVEEASKLLGRNLTKGSIVVYESTVYPGVTENICVPILEEESGLKCGADFKVGYSPERINPGDKVHRLDNITKIVSGMDEEVLEEIAKLYELVVKVGVHKAGSIKVAEAAKVVENSQRDINIAFINELAMAFDKMGIDTKEVIEAMNTKWNALGFYPGLVGGHCIGVDPYYFVYEAEKLGYHSQIISSGRRINDDMPIFIAESIIKQLVLTNKKVKEANIVFLGVTFKEDCPDVRNSKGMEIIDYLVNEYGIYPVIVDPLADKEEVKREYGYNLKEITEVKEADCIVIAVAHREFVSMKLEEFDKMFCETMDTSQKVIIDIKSIMNKKEVIEKGYWYWRL
ncbi:MAG: nucleotide sugar dehydrogenase [Lachnospiraceae bacterium]|jgi:UDP-N-acetyl-D-galactosamine dehydrogenase|nr:nucleotide sugar dehydrogenase [Lachnospiraceae bacterium]